MTYAVPPRPNMLPDSALALFLADQAAEASVAFIAESDARTDRLARLCAPFCADRVEVLTLPAWDVLPYDRTAPSPAIVGRRVHALARLAAGTGPGLLVLTSAEAVLQRVPPPSSWAECEARLRVGDAVCPAGLRHLLGERGYHAGETAVEAGEVAFHGHVVDVFPAGADDPVRLEIEDGRIAALHVFDPVTQRSIGPAGEVRLTPAIEFPLDPAVVDQALDGEDTPVVPPSGRLVPVFDYLRHMALLRDDALEERWAALRELADDAWGASRQATRAGAGVLPEPARLFLSPQELGRALARAEVPAPPGVAEPAPRKVADLIARAGAVDGPVVIAGGTEAVRLAASLVRRGLPARYAVGWPDAVAGGITCLDAEVDGGFRTDDVLVLPAMQLMRHPAHTEHATRPGRAGLGDGGSAPRTGDVVVHADHGAARLAGLSIVETAGVREERLLLAFAGDKELLCPPSELDRIWRYGSGGTIDRLDGPAWRARRHAMEAGIAEVAAHLADQADARSRRTGPAMAADRADYDRLARRFPHPLSPDQQAAVDDVLADLARGSPPTDRLVCGDVGFGKTEVALRAAAAVALSGWQVAVVAPTTVLARQHLDTFRRRFADTGIRVEGLMQAATDPRSRAVRRGLADGSIGIVVGTQGLGSPGLTFARLGLVVIDEEQRLGEALKQSMAGTHRLVMTATPIPRTLQAALVGLQEVSVIATAPVRRQPTRTHTGPFDPALVREALLREHARGGQSFVVCPRIADMAPLGTLLADLVPGLQVVRAHGRMETSVLEAAVVGFAGGEGDVLLATNIIEAGLDIPRANTIVITGADRFGLAQLHQMRGRVGRGGRRGTAYLLTDPGRRLAAATRARLHALVAQSQLGAGVALSMADMDQRGAGDLFGDRQAGHVSALGTELYQDLLLRALAARRGEPARRLAPELHVGLAGYIPEEMVPEPDLRIALYRRLARLDDPVALDAFADEMHDRFGEPMPALAELLALVRLRCQCARAGIARLDAGPRGASLTPYDVTSLPELADRTGGTLKANHVLFAVAGDSPTARVAALAELLA